jgi:chromosomal replication initiation ATPase DnaA
MIQNKEILKAVCDYYKITVEELFVKHRGKNTILQRQIFTYLLLTDSIGTLQEHVKFIFEASQQRIDHSTLIYSRDKIKSNRQHYYAIDKAVIEIRNTYPKKDFEYLEFQNSTIDGLKFSYSN